MSKAVIPYPYFSLVPGNSYSWRYWAGGAACVLDSIADRSAPSLHSSAASAFVAALETMVDNRNPRLQLPQEAPGHFQGAYEWVLSVHYFADNGFCDLAQAFKLAPRGLSGSLRDPAWPSLGFPMWRPTKSRVCTPRNPTMRGLSPMVPASVPWFRYGCRRRSLVASARSASGSRMRGL